MYDVKILRTFEDELSSYLNKRINFNFLEKIPSDVGGVVEQSQDFFIFINEAVKDEYFKAISKYTFLMLQTGITDKIISASWSIKDNLFEAISKEDMFSFSKEDTINYINFMLILRDIFYVYSSIEIYNFSEYLNDKEDFYNYINDNLFEIEHRFSEDHLSSISHIIYSVVLKSFLPHYKNDGNISILSKLIAIFWRLSRMLPLYNLDYNNYDGALSNYQSMINVLYHNASFFALDKNIISELKTFSLVMVDI